MNTKNENANNNNIYVYKKEKKWSGDYENLHRKSVALTIGISGLFIFHHPPNPSNEHLLVFYIHCHS